MDSHSWEALNYLQLEKEYFHIPPNPDPSQEISDKTDDRAWANLKNLILTKCNDC